MSGEDIIIGIDLGTTFSLVAYADERGVHVIPDESGDARLPSVLCFAPDGSTTIGWEARRQAVANADHTVCSIKRLMGLGIEDVRKELPYLSYEVVPGERETIRVRIDGRLLAPQEISALILAELKKRAEGWLKRSVRKAVITVPAFFDDSQRQATRDAGRIAGLEVVRIINEPTAAALAYGIGVPGRPDHGLPHDAYGNAREKSASIRLDGAAVPEAPAVAARGLPIGDKSKCAGGGGTSAEGAARGRAADGASQTIAVYDLGGGTFDVSILRIQAGVFEVLSTSGDTHLGGDDFDRTIIDLVRKEVEAQFGATIQSPATRQALRDFAEAVKIQLSERERAAIELDLGDGRLYRRTIERNEFEAMIDPLVERTIACFRKALGDARLVAADLDQVVLVGGSTRVPLVRRRVAAFAGRRPYTALNPDEVVALGAAVQGEILSGRRHNALLLDVTPLSLGIETMGGAMGKLIMRNARIPCRATERFTTFMDGQTSVKIRVLQGERELAADCRVLGEFDLRGVPPMPAGIPKIDVLFLIDANGILNVSAREERSGVEASIQVIPFHGLTRQEVDRMARESVAHAREDMTAHRLIDLRNQVAFDTHKTEQALSRHGHLLPAEERAALEAAMAELRAASESEQDADRLHRQLDRFGKMTEHLANLAISEALRETLNVR